MGENSFKIADVVSPEKQSALQALTTVGIDIGSRQSKAVMISGDYIHTAITASGVHPHETAARLVDRMLKAAHLSRSSIAQMGSYGQTECPGTISCLRPDEHFDAGVLASDERLPAWATWR